MTTVKSKSKKIVSEGTPTEKTAAITVAAKKPDKKTTTTVIETVTETVVQSDAAVDAELQIGNKKHKHGKDKVIRDSFSFPEQDYEKISELKKICLAAGVHVKKGEVLRAGLHLLSGLTIEQLIDAVGQVDKVKTGRPKA